MNKMKSKSSILQQIAPFSADILDPFTLKNTIPFHRKLKAIIITVTVLPLRIVVMFCILLSAWFLAFTTIRGLPEEEKSAKKPLSGWRRNWMKPFIAELGRMVFAVGGWHWIPTKGKRATAKEAPLLLLAPHTSFWDTVPVIALRCPCMVVKDAVETTPFFGDLVNYTQPVYVQRDNPNSRHHTVDEIVRRCKSGDNWEQILIFPEGTCSNGQALIDFKLGAFYPGVPVQPVFIRYPNSLDTITWTWFGPGALRQAWLTLTQLHVYCELEFLPVYTPSKSERRNPQMFATNVRKYISEFCGIPISHFSFEDIRYLKIAKTMRLPQTAALIKLLRVRRKIERDTMPIDKELSILKVKSKGMNNFSYGLQGFAEYLDTEVTEALRNLFYLLDQEKKNIIDVRIYNVGLWLLKAEINEWGRLEQGFKVFDSDAVINASQFAAIALLWRGIPIKVALDIFDVLNLDSKEKLSISFRNFKSIAISFVQLENGSYRKSAKKYKALKGLKIKEDSVKIKSV